MLLKRSSLEWMMLDWTQCKIRALPFHSQERTRVRMSGATYVQLSSVKLSDEPFIMQSTKSMIEVSFFDMIKHIVLRKEEIIAL